MTNQASRTRRARRWVGLGALTSGLMLAVSGLHGVLPVAAQTVIVPSVQVEDRGLVDPLLGDIRQEDRAAEVGDIRQEDRPADSGKSSSVVSTSTSRVATSSTSAPAPAKSSGGNSGSGGHGGGHDDPAPHH